LIITERAAISYVDEEPCGKPQGIKGFDKGTFSSSLCGKPKGIIKLKATYSKTEPIFDLTLIERVNPSGFRYFATKRAEKVFVMVSEYTEDRRHLNEERRKRMAEQLLIILAVMASRL